MRWNFRGYRFRFTLQFLSLQSVPIRTVSIQGFSPRFLVFVSPEIRSRARIVLRTVLASSKSGDRCVSSQTADFARKEINSAQWQQIRLTGCTYTKSERPLNSNHAQNGFLLNDIVLGACTLDLEQSIASVRQIEAQNESFSASCTTRGLTAVLLMTPNVGEVKLVSGLANCG
jgi:hypothetical protein